MQLEVVEGFEILSDDECRDLISNVGVGRVAVSVGALPAVLPVNYGVLGDWIVFFSGPGAKLRSAVANTVMAFEVDSFDETTESGWSVMAVGMASELSDPKITECARRRGIRPWAVGERSHLVGLHIEFLSGRRVARPPSA